MSAKVSDIGRIGKIVSKQLNPPYHHLKPSVHHKLPRSFSTLQLDIQQQSIPQQYTFTPLPSQDNQQKLKKLCFIFPGMGSQYTGMCKDLATDYPYIGTFLQECDDIIGFKLSDIMFNSDSNTLAKIEYGSVAVFVHSMCIWRILQHEYDIDNIFDTTHPKNKNISSTIIGHSMGEYAALTAANLFKSFEDAIGITNFFAQLMARYTTSDQAMCAFVCDPKDIDKNFVNNMSIINTSCDKYNVDIANINTPNQIVVSGYKENIDKVIKELNYAELYNGALRHKYLDIKGAYHSNLMRPGENEYVQKWHGLDVNGPSELHCDIYLNGIGDKYDPNKNTSTISDIVSNQICHQVYWHQCITNYFGDMTDIDNDENVEYNFIEIGPKKVLKKMIEQISAYHNYDKTKDIKIMSINNSKTIKLVEDILPK